jgi:DNA-binding beta-propeller fold protein YncE
MDSGPGAFAPSRNDEGENMKIIERLSACALVMFALLPSATLPAHAQSPAFRVDPYWPKPLPNNWIMGQIGGISVDAQDNIWVFQRPRSLTDDEKAASLNPPLAKCCVPAPSVLVFNQAGDVVKSWGGPADNLGYDWPLQEHGILADNKGFVWLGGNGKGDNMVLKFTTEGKFVKQIGKRGPLTSSTDLEQFGQVAALEIDRDANEIYAADGYGNHRVAVMDADTGVIKRVWGAYGKPPTDEPLAAYNAESPQFANPVHCIALSRDGLVFVCDRSNNRVQVFHKDGSFVQQYVFDPATREMGSSWGLAFSPLDRKQNFFVLVDGSNGVLETVRRKDGAVVRSFGRPGRNAGEFHYVHVAKFDSRGNLYTGEVDSGKRLQKWVPVE